MDVYSKDSARHSISSKEHIPWILTLRYLKRDVSYFLLSALSVVAKVWKPPRPSSY
jgi:hypothetical protein